MRGSRYLRDSQKAATSNAEKPMNAMPIFRRVFRFLAAMTSDAKSVAAAPKNATFMVEFSLEKYFASDGIDELLIV